MNAPKLWIAGLSATVLAVSGSYLWLEGIPFERHETSRE